jgi:PAS domain S-box-containing protein
LEEPVLGQESTEVTRTFGLRAALTLLVLIAIAPVFAVVVQASLSEQEGRLSRVEIILKLIADLGAAHQESLVDLSQAERHLRKLALTPEMTLLVTDARGKVLAASGARAVAVGADVPEAFLRSAIAEGGAREGTGAGAGGSGEWLYAMRPVGRTGEGKLFVVSLASRDQVLAPAAARLAQQLAALVFIALLAAFAAWMFGDRVLARPVRRLLDRVDALADDKFPFDEPLPPATLRELGQLDQRFSDVARRLAERAVQRDGALGEMEHQRHLLESVFEGMAEGVLVVDTKGRMLHMNRAAPQVLGGLSSLGAARDFIRAESGNLGVYLLDGVTPCPTDERPVSRALRGESVESFRYVVRGELSAGIEKVIQGSARPLQGPQGRPAGALVVFFDVTQDWRAEKELRDSEVRYRTLFESNPHPMWVFDRQTLRFLTVNDAAVAHYGYSREEFLAMTIEDIRPQEDLSSLHSALTTLNDLSVPKGWRHRVKSGELIWVEISSHTLDYDGHPARMVLAHDVTQLLEAHQALEQANETLERRVDERTRELAAANRELESFAYSVSHDLRAPLAAIDGFGRALLSRNAQELDEHGRHYLERIRENTRNMGELIDDLLSLARVTRSEIRSELVNLAPRARQIVERLRQRDPERQVDVEVEPDIMCLGDARLAVIALENLIENAWKFTSRAVDASIHVGSRVSPQGERVVFVSDNGAGFDMAYAHKLFNAFHRLHPASEFEGTGIGLATVHRIVTRHGGRVWAEASPGAGAIFQFTLSAGAKNEEQTNIAGRGQPGPSGAHPDDAGREQCSQ